MPMEKDPLARRLRDPKFARAYRSWLELLIDRATNPGPRRRVITLPRETSLRPPRSLAG